MTTRQIPVRLSGRSLAVVAVVLTLLAVSAQPVASTHGQLAIGSSHSDFGTGDEPSPTQTQNLWVSDRGDSASLTTDSPASAVSRWSLDDGSGSTATDDYGSNDLSISGGSWTTGVSGQALEFNGIDGNGAEASVAMDPRDGITFTTWYRHDGTPFDTYRRLLAAGDGSQYIRMMGRPDTHVVRAAASDGSTGEYVQVEVEQGWNHIAVTYNGTHLVAYLNGEPVDTTAYSDMSDLPNNFYLARSSYSGSYTLNGSVDDTRIYSDSLTEIGIQTIADNSDGTPSKPPQYLSANHSVAHAASGWVNLSLSDTATVEWQGFDGSQWQVVNSSQVSSGNHTFGISGTDYNKWRVNVSTEPSADLELHGEGVLVETEAPTVNNATATPDTTSESKGAPLELTVPVDDPDFDNSQRDTATVDFYIDGSKVATETTSSAGDVSTTISSLDAGDHTWHAEVSDEYGHSTTSATFEFTTASELRILDEQNPGQLVQDNVGVTVRLYADDSTLEREVTDGTLDLSGLPLNSTIVATTEADGWVDRRVLIRDLTQQQEIYLLNSSANSVSITFALEDKTGDFPDDTSQLYVQKAINTSSTEGLEWKTVSGDFFGADGTFPTDLSYSQRYRIVIRNNQGDVRVLGAYIPTEPGTYSVTLGEIVWDVPEGEQVVFRSNRQELGENADETYENASETLELRYNDSENVTEELHISVTTRDTNETIYETTVYGVSSYKNVVALTAEEVNKSLIVNASAARSGDHEDFEQSGQMGDIEEQNLPMDPQWVSLFTQLTIAVLICLVAGKMPKAGGLIVLPVAFAVTWFGFWSIHPASLGFAGMIALYRAADTKGGGY